MISLAGLLDLTLESGPENAFRARVLDHNCFIAFNANMQLSPLALVNRDFDIHKLMTDDTVPSHKMFMPTDLYRGVSLSRAFDGEAPQNKDIGDITEYEEFQEYVSEPSNAFHLTPIETFLSEVPEEVFESLK